MQSKIQMKEFVIDLLSNHLPKIYYYHNHLHTLYVLDIAIEIGQQENCTEPEMKLLWAAALWHDTGYLKTYTNHEKAGCILANQYLPGFGYSPGDIKKVCGMIMATKTPQSPKNKLEEIIADADLEYLGTDSAGIIANDFFKELKHLNPSLTAEKWNKMQITFLQHHQYFTQYCKEKKEPLKSKYLAKLIGLV